MPVWHQALDENQTEPSRQGTHSLILKTGAHVCVFQGDSASLICQELGIPVPPKPGWWAAQGPGYGWARPHRRKRKRGPSVRLQRGNSRGPAPRPWTVGNVRQSIQSPPLDKGPGGDMNFAFWRPERSPPSWARVLREGMCGWRRSSNPISTPGASRTPS